MKTRFAACLLLVTTAALPAQGQSGGDEDRNHADLGRTQRQFEQNRGEVERLLDLRMRHDLGLPTGIDAIAPRAATPVTTEERERLQRELAEQEGTTQSLLERYNKLRNTVEQFRAEAASQVARQREDQAFVVPQAGTAQPSSGMRPQPAFDERPAVGGSLPTPTPGPEGKPQAGHDAAVSLVTPLDKPRGVIHGSTDHLRVAQSLFKAAQDLADRAADAVHLGRTADAQVLEQRSKESLLAALEELKPLLAEKEPAYPALFYLGRCRELLFRHAERHDGLSVERNIREFQRREQEVREPFLAITKRDFTKQGPRGDVEVLGPWGMAAQAADQHFRWMNVHGRYHPVVAIDSITWPGEKTK